MAVIYYLNWDEEAEEHGPASELFHKLTVKEVLDEEEKPAKELDQSGFEDLYRELIEFDVDDPEQVFREWNRGSGYETEEFLELRYCESCDTHIEGGNEALIHAIQNHGYDQTEDVSEPDYIRGVRSFSVGDVVEIDGTYYRCENIGFEEIEVNET